MIGRTVLRKGIDSLAALAQSVDPGLDRFKVLYWDD